MDATAAQPLAKGQRLPWLDGTRILLALWVVGHHALVQGFRASNPFLWLLGQAHLAVTAFIVVSGFSIMYTVVSHGDELRGGVKGFFWRRSRRILPPYWVALAFSLVVVRFTGGALTRLDILPHILLLHDWIGDVYAFASPFWSIATEEHIYWLFPLILVAWKRFGWARTTLAAVLLSWLGQIAIDGNGFNPPAFYYFGPFCFGSAAAWLWAHRIRPPLVIGTVATVLLAALAVVCYRTQFADYLIPVDILFALGLAFLFWALASGHLRAVAKALSWAPLARAGSWSYTLYLVHYSALMALHKILDPIYPHPALQGLVFVPPVVLFAWLWSIPFERPFLSGRRDPVFPDGTGAVLSTFPILRTAALFVVWCVAPFFKWSLPLEDMMFVLPAALMVLYVAWRMGVSGYVCATVIPMMLAPTAIMLFQDLRWWFLLGPIALAAMLTVRYRDWRPILIAIACWPSPLNAAIPALVLCKRPMPILRSPTLDRTPVEADVAAADNMQP